MATIKDVAADTGLSVTTVSLVLSGKADRGGIATATRVRVTEAATRLGYRRNAYARSLRTGRSNVIGLCGVNLDHPLAVMLVRATARAVLRYGYSLSLHDPSWHPEEPDRALHELEAVCPEGVVVVNPRILYTGGGRQAMEQLAARGLPIVSLDDWDVPGADVVTVDREEGAYQATRHLLELGHRRIALTVDPEHTAHPLRDRVRGYERACRECGVPIDPSLFFSPGPGNISYPHGIDLARRALEHPARPTAMFLINDRAAIGALRALHAAGRRVPEEMALVGFDGNEEGEFSSVSITTVIQPVEEVANAAVSLLLDRIGDDRTAEPRRRTVTPKLLIRESTAGRAARSHEGLQTGAHGVSTFSNCPE